MVPKFMGLLLMLGAVVGGCSSECKNEEVRSGEKCVAVRDAGTSVDDSSVEEPGSGQLDPDAPDEGDRNVSGHTGADGGSDLDASNGSSASTDAAVVTSDGAAVATALDGASSGGTDVCLPNPCGHGKCTAAAEGFTCTCDSDWASSPLCDVNTNADLSSLAVSAGTLFPPFRSDVYEYSIDLGVAEPSVALTPTAAQPDGVTIHVGQILAPSGVRGQELGVGLNGDPRRVEVQVRANDGITSRSYAFSIRRTFGLHGELPIGGGLAVSGNRVAVAAVESNRVDLFSLSGRRWNYEYSISDDAGPLVESEFGHSVAVSSEWVVVGAPGSDSVMVASLATRQRHRITIPAGLSGVRFGARVAVSGNRVLVSNAERAAAAGVTAEPASAFIFELSGQRWTQVARFLPDPSEAGGCTSAAIEGDLVALGCLGFVPIFERTDGRWSRTATLRSPISGDHGFAGAVAISRGRVAVTAAYGCDPSFGTDCVSTANVYVFSRRADGAWAPPASFGLDVGPSVPLALSPTAFGASLAFDGNRVLVGALLQLGAHGMHTERVVGNQNQRLGGAYLFAETAGGWGLIAQFGPTKVTEGTGALQRGFAGAQLGLGVGNVMFSASVDVSGDQSSVYIWGPNCAQIPAGAGVPGC